MRSLRGRLFLLLIGATGVIWICAVAWIGLGSRSELEHVLDTRLQEAARMVHSMVESGNVKATPTLPTLEPDAYERQLSCQIWSLDGHLVARSSGAPDQSLAEDQEGYADRTLQGEVWRVYTIVDHIKGVRVAVGDRIGLRDRLVRDILAGLIAPALLIAPILGLLIWLALTRGLAPLKTVTTEIAGRDGEDMRPISPHDAPEEIRPLTTALNALFSKVEAARRHEREITAFAAHELRTPLAGLKTQAQVALATPDGPGRERALRHIVTSVDRTSRIVRQLLALATLEAAPPASTVARFNVGEVLQDVVGSTPKPDLVCVVIDETIAHLTIRGDPDDLKLVLRNLHENAIEHMPEGGRITWNAMPGGHGIVVADQGSGVDEDDLPRITERFFRGRNKSTSGTGLGLTIAAMAARRLGAVITFQNQPEGSGLIAELQWGGDVS
ncbi:ATP-binding protein [Agrobacterium vitis]|uniref:ATP-binding protein n=1 Tax=Agrobacterium vitis TaxID=373 RepID=UPI003D27CAF8